MSENIVENLLKTSEKWVKLWSAKGSLHFDSNLGEVYTKINHFNGKPAFENVIFFYNEGLTACWVSKEEMNDFGKRLSSSAKKDPHYIESISEALILNAKKITAFIESHDANKIKPKEFDEFWSLVRNYYIYHISVKYIIDYLSKEELAKAAPILEKSRLFSEPIYRNLENYMASISDKIASEVSGTREMILSTTKQELRKYFETKNLPNQIELKNRYNKSTLVFIKQKYQFLKSKEIEKLEKTLFSQIDSNVIKGEIAYKGIVQGRVRIVLDPSKAEFSEGDILVTGMTRPEYSVIMKKSSGIITDAGGILSHAAIMARELKKPCVMSTQNATKILKDGDFVELDANQGLIKIIKRK